MHKMQNTKLLSICIPTFNEEKNIIKILNSIFDQYSNQINVVVSDNHSDDNTISLIKNYFPSYIESKDLHIFQNKRNIGQILNYKNVIFRAKTKFVWLVGADDLIAKGSIKKILSFIRNKNPDILSGIMYRKSR